MNKKIKVTHDLKDFDEGEYVILTLKDQQLIKGEDLNSEDEELENVEMREKGYADFNQYLRYNIKKLAHAETSHLQYKLYGKTDKVLLPHYDEIKYHKYGFHLEKADDSYTLLAPKATAKAIAQQKYLYSLMTKHNKVASEYEAIDKKSIKPRKVDKNKSVKELMNFLEDTAVDEPDDRDSIKRKAEYLLDDLDQVKKKRNFDKAIYKAMESNRQMQLKAKYIEEYELYLALRRKKKYVNTEEEVKKLLSKSPEVAEEYHNTVEMDLDSLNVARLKAETQPSRIDPKQFKLKDAREGYTSVLNVSLPSERRSTLNPIKYYEDLPYKFEDIPEEELERMKEEVSFMHPEDLGVGLSGVLKYIRDTGISSQDELVGRSLDRKPKPADSGYDRIKLEYLDGQGRPMAPRYAYRYMCWIFHGEGPGKNKIEKRKRRELLYQRTKMLQSGDSTMMRLLSEYQKRTGEAYMTISQQNK